MPGISPLTSCMWHPLFWQTLIEDTFKKWKQEGLDKFSNLGSGRWMHFMLQKTRELSWAIFQYGQVIALVYTLMRKGNIFRLMTSFDTLLALTDKMKVLSKVYSIFFSKREYNRESKISLAEKQ